MSSPYLKSFVAAAFKLASREDVLRSTQHCFWVRFQRGGQVTAETEQQVLHDPPGPRSAVSTIPLTLVPGVNAEQELVVRVIRDAIKSQQ